MTIELIKQLLDACYLAKRAREMLPALPEGVTSSYIPVSYTHLDVYKRQVWWLRRMWIPSIRRRFWMSAQNQ